jgi:DNA modification methylase
VLDGLRMLPDGCVHCCVTSPPYWSLRDYKIGASIWGGDRECEHDWGEWAEQHSVREETQHGKTRTTDRHYGDESRRFDGNHQKHTAGQFCVKCGAWRGNFGLEPTAGLFVEHAVEIFREVKRVLRDDATLWLNLGDCYNAFNGGAGPGSQLSRTQSKERPALESGFGKRAKDLKAGDLCNIPHRVAEALQADGWYWRSTIVWAKRSPMPESVAGWRWVRHKVKSGRKPVDWSKVPKGWDSGEGSHDKVAGGNYRTNGEREATVAVWEDCPGCNKCRENDGLVLRRGSWRPTTSHEYIFLLSKTDSYFCDGEAVREACVSNGGASFGNVDRPDEAAAGMAQARHVTREDRERYITQGRNMRGVWTLSSEPFPKAHFATFPTEIPRRCISAGTSAKGYCASCGEPWAPVVNMSGNPSKGTNVGDDLTGGAPNMGGNRQTSAGLHRSGQGVYSDACVIGWRATCKCNAETAPGIVLDPFSGAGTTGVVARRLGLRYIGFELNPDYAEMARQRIRDDSPLFNGGAAS